MKVGHNGKHFRKRRCNSSWISPWLEWRSVVTIITSFNHPLVRDEMMRSVSRAKKNNASDEKGWDGSRGVNARKEEPNPYEIEQQ